MSRETRVRCDEFEVDAEKGQCNANANAAAARNYFGWRKDSSLQSQEAPSKRVREAGPELKLGVSVGSRTGRRSRVASLNEELHTTRIATAAFALQLICVGVWKEDRLPWLSSFETFSLQPCPLFGRHVPVVSSVTVGAASTQLNLSSGNSGSVLGRRGFWSVTLIPNIRVRLQPMHCVQSYC